MAYLLVSELVKVLNFFFQVIKLQLKWEFSVKGNLLVHDNCILPSAEAKIPGNFHP